MEHALSNVRELEVEFDRKAGEEQDEVEQAEEMKRKLLQAIVEVRMAADNIVGGLEALIAETDLKLEYIDDVRAVRQAAGMRYGYHPRHGLDYAGVNPKGFKVKQPPPLLRSMANEGREEADCPKPRAKKN